MKRDPSLHNIIVITNAVMNIFMITIVVDIIDV
jgi:hypothetical protein